MKRRRRIALGIFTLAVLASLIFWKAQPSSSPVLVFEGYETAATNGTQLVRLKLQNTTRQSVWLFFSGDAGSTITPGFLERPMIAPHETTNAVQTNLYSVKIGSFFMYGEELRPGASRFFDFPLVSGKPAEQLGISYYVGSFKDSRDFFAHMALPILQNDASFKDRLKFYWEKFKRHFGGPKQREVWCQQPVSFQKGAPTDVMPPTNKPL